MSKVVLQLFISGSAPYGQLACETVQKMIAMHPDLEFELDVIDILEQPEQTAACKVIATPTLIKAHPTPKCRVLGQLNDPLKLSKALYI